MFIKPQLFLCICIGSGLPGKLNTSQKTFFFFFLNLLPVRNLEELKKPPSNPEIQCKNYSWLLQPLIAWCPWQEQTQSPVI